MLIRYTAARGLAAAIALSILVAGCSGSSTASVTPAAPPAGSSPTTEEIHGVATPSSVAVVTATNAQ